MISRAIQYINYGSQSVDYDEKIKFNKLVQRWNNASSKPITYANGVFTIPNASTNHYYISWSFSIRSSISFYPYYVGLAFQMISRYGTNGTIAEACMCTNYNITGLVKGYKILNIIKKEANDTLTLWIQNNSFYNTTYFPDTSKYLPDGVYAADVANASICIIAI